VRLLTQGSAFHVGVFADFAPLAGRSGKCAVVRLPAGAAPAVTQLFAEAVLPRLRLLP
jgi:hypothetical protein